MGRSFCPLHSSIAIALTVLVSAGRLLAADRFVATAGNDTANDCLAAGTPCATIGHALTQAASLDTIKISRGTYREGTLVIDSSTTLTLSGGWAPGFGSQNSAAYATRLDGQHLGNILQVAAAAGESIDLTVEDLTFTRSGPSFPPTGAVQASAVGDGALALTFRRSTFTRNWGGGIRTGAQDTGTLNVIVEDSVITRSTTRRSPSGSGTYANSRAIGVTCVGACTASLVVTRTLVRRNTNAGVYSSSIALFHGSSGTMDADIVDSVLTRNRFRQGGEGGAIHVNGGSGIATVRITNTIISGNRAESGGGIITAGGLVNLVVNNSTITGNRASSAYVTALGGGIELEGTGNTTLRNTILWGNRAKLGGDILQGQSPGGNVDADHSDIGDRFVGTNPNNTFNDLGGNVNVKPKVTGSGHLVATSPMIDAGDCTGAPPTDIDGDPRPTGGGCDIGADEFVP